MNNVTASHAETAPEPIETKEESPLIKAVRDFVGRVFSDEKTKGEKEGDLPGIESLEGEALIAKAMGLRKDPVKFDALLKKVFVKLDEKNLPLLHKLHREILGIDLEDGDLMAIHSGLSGIGNGADIYSFLKSDSRIIENIHEAREAGKAGNLVGNIETELSRIISAYCGRFMQRQKDPGVVYRSDVKVHVKKDMAKKGDETEIPMDDPEHKVIPIVKPHPELKVVANQEEPENSDHQVA